MSVRLDRFHNQKFERGRPAWVEGVWLTVQALLVASWLPGSWHRRVLLRAFGARIGRGVVIKPGVRVKFPWRLVIGDHAWIGEDVWIDNLDQIAIGSHCCLSQGAYLCTGSHDWTSPNFDLVTSSIVIEDGAWICAKAMVGPGVRVGAGAVLTATSFAAHDLTAWSINQGLPAQRIGTRKISSEAMVAMPVGSGA